MLLQPIVLDLFLLVAFSLTWSTRLKSRPLQVDGSVVTNSGSENKWTAVVANQGFSSGRHRFDVHVIHDAPSTNTWRIGIGIASKNFDPSTTKCWFALFEHALFLLSSPLVAHLQERSHLIGVQLS